MWRILALSAWVVLVGCASDVDPDVCEKVLIVTFGVQVSPDGELERFEVHPPSNCNGDPSAYELSRAWKISACMYQALHASSPTYEVGDEPTLMYWSALYDLRMPHRFLPNADAGKTRGNPAVQVQEELPADLDANEPDHLCAGSLDAHAA